MRISSYAVVTHTIIDPKTKFSPYAVYEILRLDKAS